MAVWNQYGRDHKSEIIQAMRAACHWAGVEYLDTMTEKDFGWRFEDRTYSVADEYGDHSYSYTQIEFAAYVIHHRTPKGMWLLYTGNGLNMRFSDRMMPDRFVNLHANKKWAVDSVQGAIDSFVARKERQARIHEARAKKAREAIIMVRPNIFNGGPKESA